MVVGSDLTSAGWTSSWFHHRSVLSPRAGRVHHCRDQEGCGRKHCLQCPGGVSPEHRAYPASDAAVLHCICRSFLQRFAVAVTRYATFQIDCRHSMSSHVIQPQIREPGARMQRLWEDMVEPPMTTINSHQQPPYAILTRSSAAALHCQLIAYRPYLDGTEFLEDAVLGRHGRRRANLGLVPQVPHRSYSYVRLVRVKLHSPLGSGHPSYSLILPFWLRALRPKSRSGSAGRPAPVLFFIAASFF